MRSLGSQDAARSVPDLHRQFRPVRTRSSEDIMKVFVAGANGAYRAVDNAGSRLSGRKILTAQARLR